MAGGQWFTRIQGRVQGPFSFEQLVTMKNRGRLNRIHEVSQDRQSWQRAGTIEMLFGAQDRVSASVAVAPLETGAPAASAEGDQWFYAVQGNRLGPVPLAMLTQLIVSGQLRADDHVWKQDFPDWVPARHVPELQAALAQAPALSSTGSTPSAAPPLMPMSLWIGVGIGTAALLILVAVGGAFWFLGFRPANPLPAALVSSQITSIEGPQSEERLKQALGFVVCGAKVTLLDGSIREVPSSTGTAFAVTSDGYMITNKHVVDESARMLRADKLRDRIIENLDLEDLEPMVWVFVGPKPYPAKIVYVSPEYDLAILKVERKGTPYFALSTTDTLARQDRVFALGFPAAATDPLTEWGAEEKATRMKNAQTIRDNFNADNFEYTQQDGAISRMLDRHEDRTGRVVQHSASLNPGNSGGPLVGREGIVRGVNTFRISDAQGINFAICMPQLRAEIDKHIPGVTWTE